MRYGAVVVVPNRMTLNHDAACAAEKSALHTVKGIIKEFFDAGIDEIALIEPCCRRSVLKTLESQSVIYVRGNSSKADFVDLAGQGFSVLAERCDRVFITSIDDKLITRETLLELMGSRADVMLPMSGGKVVHPLLLGSRLAPWFKLYNGTRGVMGVVDSVIKTRNGSVKTVNLDMLPMVRYMNARNGYHKLIHEPDLSQLMRRSG